MDNSCVFCQIIDGKSPARIVYEDRLSVAFLDIRPRTRGHMQLVPKIHYRWIYECPDMGKIFGTARDMIRVIIPLLGADHVTMGTFGNEVPHAHIWIIPQYQSGIHIWEGSSKRDASDPDEVAILLRSALMKEVSR